MKKALITGALGQDGSYMAEHLLKLGYEVWGTCRRYASDEIRNDNYILGVNYLYADLRDEVSLEAVIRKSAPDEIYNFGGVVFVPTSWMYPSVTFDCNVGGLARILNILERMDMKHTRVYQASSSEMYGNVIKNYGGRIPLREDFHMYPVSPYGIAKLAAHRLCEIYRQKGMYVVGGICFNHESPRRGPEMVTRKITRHIAGWVKGDRSELRLGENTKRDWGFAGDYVEAMHLMLQQSTPDDYVVGTGEAHSISDFLKIAIETSGLDVADLVKMNCPEFTRKNELYTLVSDISKARRILKWEPKHTFKQLVEMMVEADVKKLNVEKVEKVYV